MLFNMWVLLGQVYRIQQNIVSAVFSTFNFKQKHCQTRANDKIMKYDRYLVKGPGKFLKSSCSWVSPRITCSNKTAFIQIKTWVLGIHSLLKLSRVNYYLQTVDL